MKVLIVYYSRAGSTKKIAETLKKHIESNEVSVKLSFVQNAQAKEMLEYDGIIIGSPTYYGTMAAEIKQFLDESVSFHGKLDGKIGGAFTSSANLAGGNETTILSILEAMLIHGMIIQGDPKGDHYGPVALGNIDKRCEENCKRFSQRFVKLLKSLGLSK